MPTPAFISALKSDRCVHYLNNVLLTRAQSFDINANVPTEVIDEIGNSSHAGVSSAPPEVALSVSVFDTGVDLARSLTGRSAATSFSLEHFANAQVDYVGLVRDNSGNFYRSVYVRNACINSIQYGYDTAGNAVEAYSMLGDNLTVFDGYVLTKSYTIVDPATKSFILPLTGAEAPIPTKSGSYFNGAYILQVARIANNVKVNLKESDYSYDAPTKKISLLNSFSTELAAGQVFTITFYSAQTGTSVAPVFNAAVPAVRGEFTPVSIGLSTKTLIPRLQTAKIGINLAQKRVPQLGSRQVLYASGAIPSVGGSFSVLMNDLSLRKLLTYGNTGSGETQFGIEQLPAYGAQNNLGLEAMIKSPVDNTVLKRITVPDIVVDSGGMPSTVNGTLTESFTWTGRTGTVTIANS